MIYWSFDMVMTIPLRGNTTLSVLIDAEDYHLVSPFKWYLHNGYAITAYHNKGESKLSKKRTKNLSMHRLISDAQKGEIVDHVNRDRLDCRKVNLRKVSYAQNSWNTPVKLGDSGLIGVFKVSDTSFMATASGVTIGHYSTASDAALARDKYVLLTRGEDFSILNMPLEDVLTGKDPIKRTRRDKKVNTGGCINYANHRKSAKRWRAMYRHKNYGWFLTKEEAELRLAEVLSAINI